MDGIWHDGKTGDRPRDEAMATRKLWLTRWSKEGYCVKSRAALKALLLLQRRDCDWCDRPLQGDADMHEWLIKRHLLPRDKRIFDERNCALLHHTCHMAHGKSKQMQDKLAEVFIGRYGRAAMLRFITGLGLRSPEFFIRLVSREFEWR